VLVVVAISSAAVVQALSAREIVTPIRHTHVFIFFSPSRPNRPWAVIWL
jgi:hypothetical protein